MAAPRTLLLTRPRGQSEAFAAVLAAELPGRFRPVVSPVLEIVPLPAPLDLDGLQGLIFTSANGVEQFAARSPDRSLPAWCVGEMTAAAARRAGFAARSADGDVGDLAALVVAGHRPGAGDFLHLRGAHAAGDLTGRLAAAGVPARAAAIYDQRPRPLTAEALALLAAGGMDVLTFFSPRTARLVAAAGHGAGWNLSRTVAVALSPAADAAFAGPEPALRRIAAAPTRDGMLAALAAADPDRGRAGPSACCDKTLGLVSVCTAHRSRGEDRCREGRPMRRRTTSQRRKPLTTARKSAPSPTRRPKRRPGGFPPPARNRSRRRGRSRPRSSRR